MEPTRQALLTENGDLKRRLSEVEKDLEALRSLATDTVASSSPEAIRPEARAICRQLLEQVNDGAALLTAAGNILYANGRLAQMLGLTLDRLMGSPFRDYISAADRQVWDNLVIRDQGGEGRGAVLLQAVDGSPVPVHLTCQRLPGEDGFGALSLVVTDLTAFRHQEALLADAKLYQEILLRTEQAIAVCDRTGRIIRVSEGMAKLCGRDPLHLPFEQACFLKLPLNQPLLLDHLLQGEVLHNVEAYFQRPDGQPVHVLVNAGPMRDDGAQITGFVAVLTDITERQQAEQEKQELLERLQVREEQLSLVNEELRAQAQELRESREDLAWAQEVAHTGSWRLDVQQNKLTWSEENHRIFGIPPGTPMTYETFLSIVHPEDREYVNEKWQAALQGEPYDIEHRLVVDGAVKWVQERAELEFDDQGRLLGGFGITRDITEDKRAADALRESEERLRLAARAGRMFAFEWDPDTDAVKRSPEAGLILGLHGEAATRDTSQGFFAKILLEDRDVFVQMLQGLNPESARYNVSYRVRRPDNGQIVWLEESALAVFDGKGKLQRLYGMTMDVTARKQAEAELKAANRQVLNEKKRLEAVMAALPVGMAIVDEQGGLTHHNRAYDEIWGYSVPSPRQVRDYEPFKAWWPDTGKRLEPEEWASAQAVLEGKTVIGQILEIERFDGGRRYILNNAAPVRDTEGRIAGCAVGIVDITEQRLAEEALRTSEARLRLALDAAQAGTWEWDLSTNENFWSEELWHLYGLEPHSCTPSYESWRDTVHFEDRAQAERVVQEAARQGTELNVEWRVGDPDGKLRWLMSRGRPLRAGSGQLTHYHGIVLDITDRKQAEEALKESEERYRNLVELSPDAILVIQESKYVFANQAAAELFGTKIPDAIVGQNVLDLVPPGFWGFVSCRIKEVLAGDQENRQEAEIMRVDGQSVEVEASARAISYHGKPSILIIFRDITVQKKAQEELRRAHAELEERVRERTRELQLAVTRLQEEVQERLKAEAELNRQSRLVYDLYNQAPCGYHSLDAGGNFVQINDTELTWLGYTRDEVVGRMKFQDIMTAEGREIFQKNFPIFLERGWVKDLEYNLIRKDGSLLPVLLSATAVTDETGNFLMSRGTVYDLTDRLQAEADLARERQRLFQVLEQLPAYVVLLCPDYTVAYANREFIRRFGVAQEGQRCYEFLFSRDKPCEECITFRVLETNSSEEWEWLGPDGHTYGVYDYPFTDVDGAPLILELGLDITRRKQAELSLKESEEKLRHLAAQLLSAQESERKRIASELHDELGHALLTLKIQLRLLEKQLTPEQLVLGEEIESMVEYLDKVINDVRRLYEALTPGDLEDFGLTTALGNVVEEFVSLHDTISWSLTLDNIDDLFPPAAQTVIYRILQELLTNIGKHAHASRAAVSIKKDDQGVMITVEDDGRGFDVEKVLISTAPNKGLGLPAMEERVKILGGSLSIWSQEGQGTKITFTIPVAHGGLAD